MITVDPGVNYFAWAGWLRDGTLRACGLWSAKDDLPIPFLEFDGREVIVEVPGRRWRGTEKDVLQLATAAGYYAGVLSRGGAHRFVEPSQWKGQVPKEVHHPRIVAALAPEEQARLPVKKGALVHVLDAVGIGLWALGRKV